MKVIGSVIINMDRDIKNSITNVFTQEIMLMVDLKESEDIAGLMGSFIKDNG